MLVRCAWCEREGHDEVLRVIDGPVDKVSHGICDMHQAKMLEEIANLKEIKGETNPKRRKRSKKRKA